MSDRTLRMRMELLADRLDAAANEPATPGRPDAENPDWRRAQAAAYARAADWVRQELARD